MVVRNEGQALCVAVEMERRAIRVYERALCLAIEPEVAEGIREILQEERAHLKRFSAMRAAHPVGEAEERQLISAMAAEVLFPGGVMELNRAQALATLHGLYEYAAKSEAEAVETYGRFADGCRDEGVRDAFLSIVQEESRHLAELTQKLNEEEA